jgi:mannose-6-phosphate isomerase-like protein (cupin superfamily)
MGDARSVFVIDESVASISVMPGSQLYRIWGSDELVELPTDGTRPSTHRWFPPPSGFRFAVFTLAPERSSSADDADLEEAEQGTHQTDTVDFDVVLSGEVWLELDGGAEVRLGPGDCVIQNGTRHAWHNRANEPCVMAVAMVGATRKS